MYHVSLVPLVRTENDCYFSSQVFFSYRASQLWDLNCKKLTMCLMLLMCCLEGAVLKTIVCTFQQCKKLASITV